MIDGLQRFILCTEYIIGIWGLYRADCFALCHRLLNYDDQRNSIISDLYSRNINNNSNSNEQQNRLLKWDLISE